VAPSGDAKKFEHSARSAQLQTKKESGKRHTWSRHTEVSLSISTKKIAQIFTNIIAQ